MLHPEIGVHKFNLARMRVGPDFGNTTCVDFTPIIHVREAVSFEEDATMLARSRYLLVM